MEANLRGKKKQCKLRRKHGRIWWRTYGDRHMAAWVYIKSSGRNKLVNVDGNLNRENSISFLQSHIRAGSEDAVSFLNDTAPC